MARIQVDKQPYSDLSSQSLRDFLRDKIFEFSIFHIIGYTAFYKLNGNTDETVDLRTAASLYGPIKDKPKPERTFVQSMLSKQQYDNKLLQIFAEESNYYFIKRLDDQAWSTN